MRMRGDGRQLEAVFSYLSMETRIPLVEPVQRIPRPTTAGRTQTVTTLEFGEDHVRTKSPASHCSSPPC